jgi:hypothetical protein
MYLATVLSLGLREALRAPPMSTISFGSLHAAHAMSVVLKL